MRQIKGNELPSAPLRQRVAPLRHRRTCMLAIETCSFYLLPVFLTSTLSAMLLCNLEGEFVTTKETALYPHVRSDPFGILRTTFFIDYRNLQAERG